MKKLAQIKVSVDGRLEFGDHVFRCSLGRRGVTNKKREGDGATPAGTYPLRHLLYRPDRLALPNSNLTTFPIQFNDGWCDDPNHSAYNKPVILPVEVSAERLWRNDHLYDLMVILGHNDDPAVPGLGSAIFLHIASHGYDPTEGCIALAKDDLLTMLQELPPECYIHIQKP